MPAPSQARCCWQVDWGMSNMIHKTESTEGAAGSPRSVICASSMSPKDACTWGVECNQAGRGFIFDLLALCGWVRHLNLKLYVKILRSQRDVTAERSQRPCPAGSAAVGVCLCCAFLGSLRAGRNMQGATHRRGAEERGLLLPGRHAVLDRRRGGGWSNPAQPAAGGGRGGAVSASTVSAAYWELWTEAARLRDGGAATRRERLLLSPGLAIFHAVPLYCSKRQQIQPCEPTGGPR